MKVTKHNTIILEGGHANYSMEDSAESIDALIEALKRAKREGAKYVVMESGNLRGAQWSSIGSGYEFASDAEL